MAIRIGVGMIEIDLLWAAFKSAVGAKGLAIQFEASPAIYKIFAIDDSIVYTTVIHRNALPVGVNSVDQSTNDANKADFETNYQAGANKRTTLVVLTSGSISGSQTPITGSVNITNFPLIQTVTGSVLSLPSGVQPVTGSVNVTGSVGISNFPLVQSITGSVALTQKIELVSGSVSRPLFVEPTGGRLTILSGAFVNVAGSSVVTWQGWSEWYLIINASGSAGGTSPQLQFKIEEVDPIDKITLIGESLTGSFITASKGIDVMEITDTVTDTFRISWTVSGANAFFSGVNVSWVGHAAGNSIEGQNNVGELIKGSPLPIGGVDSNTRVRYIKVDSDGRVLVASAGASAPLAGFIFGGVATSGGAQIKVHGTTYTEMTGSVQRSIVSANAADAAAGTGARKVMITYLKSDYSGPYTEIITLNGTSAVNTVATDICFIEKMEVTEIGSSGANAGIISLKSQTGGNGVTIGSIGVSTLVAGSGGDNRTLWSHHYVPTGKICYITSVTVGHNNNTSQGSGGTFHLRSQISGSNKVDVQVTDFIHQYGQASSTPRVYGTPIAIAGPSRLTAYVFPDASLTVNYLFSFDFYEQ